MVEVQESEDDRGVPGCALDAVAAEEVEHKSSACDFFAHPENEEPEKSVEDVWQILVMHLQEWDLCSENVNAHGECYE
ncbi:MAG: hypothetical protein RL414_1242 [Actinomycetota bacterium]